MTGVQESPWYQEILGQGARRQLLKLLECRFGTVAPNLGASLDRLNSDQLEHLVDVALKVNSLEAFFKWVPLSNDE